jgi:hypothetical protein
MSELATQRRLRSLLMRRKNSVEKVLDGKGTKRNAGRSLTDPISGRGKHRSLLRGPRDLYYIGETFQDASFSVRIFLK